MQTLSSLAHFAAGTMAPMFAVPDVYHDPEHPAHSLLLADINSIPEEESLLFKIDAADLESLMSDDQEKELQWKLFFLMEELTAQISALRIQYLTATSLPLAPYDHPELVNLPVDEFGLVYLHHLQGYHGGFILGEEVFTIAPSTQGINSTYWLLQSLYDSSLSGKVKIRLDPLIHQLKEDFHSMAYRMQVYGKALDWDRIRNLKVIEHIEFIPDNQRRGDILKTEITWRPNGNEIHFTCEELPKPEKLWVRGSRYFHAIFYKETGIIEHCDGANRFYTPEQFTNRLKNHIKNNEVTKSGTRIKLFHVTEPSHELLVNLITTFFVWNDDILLYFNPQLKNEPYFQRRKKK